MNELNNKCTTKKINSNINLVDFIKNMHHKLFGIKKHRAFYITAGTIMVWLIHYIGLKFLKWTKLNK